MKVKTAWNYSVKSEAERLLFTAHQIVVGFYRVNNFIVLPYPQRVAGANLVSFPDLPYNTIPRFWERVKKIEIADLPFNVDEDLVSRTIDLLKNGQLESPKFKETQKIWAKSQDEIINEIYKIMPDKKSSIKEVNIYPTCFGTTTSFGQIKNGKINIYLRQDCGTSSITEAILSALTRTDVFNKLDGLWQESEIIVDWLVTETVLAKTLLKYQNIDNFLPTIKGVRVKQQASQMQDSIEFYKKLGLPGTQQIFGLNGLMPEINKKPMENLSLKERLILKKLIENANSAVSFDAIADEVFKSENDFSLYAISKTIERLRNKLEENGISGSYIQTLRGQGYVLKN